MPLPILILLGFIGLLVYAVIGGIVGTLAVKIFGSKPGTNSYYCYGGHLEGIAGIKGGDGDAWWGFGTVAILWPAIIAVAIALGIVTGTLWLIFILPYILCRSVGQYSAKVLAERRASA